MRAFNDVAPYTDLVDADQPHPLSFFETVVGMAYGAFADAPVDVGRGRGRHGRRVGRHQRRGRRGRGGAADRRRPRAATSATTSAAIALEKAGIIKPGATAILAEQTPEVAEVLLAPGRRGRRHRGPRGPGVRRRRRGCPPWAARRSSLQGLRARYDEVFLPLYGAHQAQNAAVALAAVEAFLGGDQPLDEDLVRAAFAEVTSPGRLEIIRRSPTILLDAAHNPARRRGRPPPRSRTPSASTRSSGSSA